MKLTEKEKSEKRDLEILKSSSLPMLEAEYKRLKYLNQKEFHNNCSNIHCTGYDGTEHETICPKCNFILIKSI